MTQPLKGVPHFVWAALVRQRQTGGLVPSQRFLIQKMIAPVPTNYAGTLLELGTGIGALTLRLAERCRQARIVAWEINPDLARQARLNLDQAGVGDRVELINGSATDLIADMRRRGMAAADFVISGVPLANLGKARSESLIGAAFEALGSGGMYVQFQHSTHHQEAIKARFDALRTVTVLLNIPPAVVYYATRFASSTASPVV
ncbi:MAG: class I SAM-dependent methyltransferase [Gemmatimonadales bacterium]